MTIPHVEYVLLDGQRFALREGRYTRAHLITETSQIRASRSESPFLDGLVTGFGAGIKPEQMDDTADWLADAAGFEPYGTVSSPPFPLLRIGKALAQAYTAAGAGVLRPLDADDGYLFAGEMGSDKVLNSADGAAWTAIATGSGSTAGVSALGARAGATIAGFADEVDPWLSTDHGATWAVYAITNSGPLGIVGTALIVPLGVENDGTGLPARWLIVSTTSGLAVASTMSIDGSISGSVVAFLLAESTATAGCSDGATAYICGAETTNPIRGQLYSYSYAASADVAFLAPLDGNYATAMAFYDGAPYLGCHARGEVYRLDGGALELVQVLPTTLPIRGMTVHAGALWVLIYSTAGRLELHRYDGTGWSQPHFLGATLTASGGLVAFGGALYGAAGDGTTRKVYAVSPTAYHATARVVLPDAVYGDPSAPKRYRRVQLQHTALLAGQSVEALYSLDGAAYVSLGTNWKVGSTRTRFELPETAIGGRLSAWFSFTNDPTLTLTVYGGGVRALPAPDAREVWDCELILNSQVGFVWASDAAADNADTIEKWEALAALHDRCEVFQAVDPFRTAGGQPRRAMLATLDVQGELAADFAAARVDGAHASMRVRILQAGTAENLLVNASFERDTAGSAPTGWTLAGTVTTWQTDTAAFAIDGTRVLTITYNGASATPSVYQAVTVIPGRYYTLSGYLRRAGLSGGSAAAYLRVSEAGSPISGAATTSLPAGSDASLVRYQATFRVPDASTGTVAVEVYASGTPGGAIYADALMLEPFAPASPFRERGA